MKTKTLLIVLLISIIIFSCRSKVKIVEKEEIKKVEQIKVDSIIEQSKDLKKDSIVKIKKEQEEKIKSNVGDIEIKGKSDTITPFIYRNIQNGDTLQSISIFGNADFIIKSKWENYEVKKKTEDFTESLNKVAEYSRKAVSKETINKATTEIKKLDKKVTEKSSPLSMTLMYIIIFIIIICAIWLFYYLGGKIKWSQLFSKFVKNK